MIGDKGYDRDEYRAALKAKGIEPCICPWKCRVLLAIINNSLYRQQYQSKIWSVNLKTGDVSTKATTEIRAILRQPSVSKLMLSSNSINEV